MRERSGVTIAGGQGELKGKIVRIGHIGYVGLDDVVAALWRRSGSRSPEPGWPSSPAAPERPARDADGAA